MNDGLTSVTAGRRDGLTAGVIALGTALVVAGWWGASRQVVVSDQIMWGNLAAAGVVVGLAGETMWLFRMRRAVLARHCDLVEARQLAIARVAAPEPGRIVAVSGLRYFHRANCPLVAGKVVDKVVPAAVDARRGPCGICRP